MTIQLSCLTNTILNKEKGERITLSQGERVCVCGAGGGGGVRCLQGKLWCSPPANMTSRTSRVSDFQNGNKVFIEETDKNLDFTTEILLRFLGFGDFKVSIVIEN